MAEKGLFFVQIFGLFLSDAVSKRAPNHRVGRFLRDAIGDAQRSWVWLGLYMGIFREKRGFGPGLKKPEAESFGSRKAQPNRWAKNFGPSLARSIKCPTLPIFGKLVTLQVQGLVRLDHRAKNSSPSPT
jgi:hypothetical protein